MSSKIVCAVSIIYILFVNHITISTKLPCYTVIILCSIIPIIIINYFLPHKRCNKNIGIVIFTVSTLKIFYRIARISVHFLTFYQCERRPFHLLSASLFRSTFNLRADLSLSLSFTSLTGTGLGIERGEAQSPTASG